MEINTRIMPALLGIILIPLTVVSIISYTSALFLAPLRFNPQAALNRTDPRHDLPNPVIQALQKHESLLVDAVDYRGQPALDPRVTDGMYDSQRSMLRRL